MLSTLVALLLSASAQDIPRPVAVDERLAVDLVAREPDIVTPTGVAVDARGRIWAIENNTHFRPKDYKGHASDRIRIYEDFGPDGYARKVTDFADGFKDSMGLALGRQGEVYLATRGEIFILREGGEKKTLARLETAGNYPHNGLSGFAFDERGDLHFGLGENLGAAYKIVGADGTALEGGGEGGNIYRLRPDGTGLSKVATGFWNPFGMGFDAFGRLFAVDNDPDSRPPNRLLHIVQGGDYGYRFRNGRRGLHPFTAWNGELPGTLPMVSGAGEGVCGVLAYESDGLPPDFRGTLLVTLWADYQVQRFRLEPRGASFHARPETIVRGADGFRPVGLTTAPDGSVVFTDWADKSYPIHGKGRIWRLRSKIAPVRDGRPSLSHARREWREAAAAAKSPAELADALEREPDPRARIAALWAAPQLAEKALADPAEEIRAAAAKLLHDRLLLLKDPSNLVRFQAIRTVASKDSRPALLPFLADADPFLVGAALDVLGQAANVDFLKEHAAEKDPKLRLGVLLALRRAGEKSVVRAFLEDPEPALRRAAIQWVGEEGLTDLAPAIAAASARPPVTREVFEAFIAASDFLDPKARTRLDQQGSDAYLAKVIAEAAQPAALRALALRMIRKDHPSLTPALLGVLLESDDADLRLEAARATAVSADPAAQETLRTLARDPKAGPAIRAEAAMGLARSAEASAATREALVALGTPEALRSLGAAAPRPEVKEALANLGKRPELAELSALLLGAAAPVPDDEWRRISAEPGDAAAGERIFFHPRGPQCFVCHRANGRGGDVGPDLSSIGQTMDRTKLVESILDPSKDVAPLFVSWQIATKGGEEFEGRILAEDPPGMHSFVDAQGKTRQIPGALSLINAQGAVTKVPLADVKERRALKASIMPEKLLAVLTRRDFRDLLAFLATLK